MQASDQLVDSVLSVTAPNVTLAAGDTTALSISLNNGEMVTYNGYQFDITFPEGVTIAKDGSDFAYSLSDRYTGEMLVKVHDFGDGHYRILVFSLTNTTITGTEGAIITLSLAASDDIQDGNHTGSISQIRLSTTSLVTLLAADTTFNIIVGNFIMGDVNHDGIVDVVDVMATVSKALGKGVTPFHAEQADINKDGEIDVSDVMSIVNIVLNSKQVE